MKSGDHISSVGKESGFIDLCSRPRYESRELHWLHVVDSCPSVGMRFIASAFDLIMVSVLLVLFVSLVYGQTWLVYHSNELGVSFYLSLMLVPLVYFVGFWSFVAATPGKMLLSLRIIDVASQGQPSVLQCFLRFAGYVLNVLTLGLGVVGMCLQNKPYGWHDRLARTLVVKR
ncbi:MAG: hypothetical protein RI964_194 [Pseudomonadota bacterium]